MDWLLLELFRDIEPIQMWPGLKVGVWWVTRRVGPDRWAAFPTLRLFHKWFPWK